MSFYDVITLIINIILIIIFIIVVVWFIKEYRTVSLQRRLGTYTINSLKENKESAFDKISNKYLKIQKYVSKKLLSIKFLVKYSKKYEKYIDRTIMKDSDPMYYVTTKIFSSIIILFFVQLNNVLQGSTGTILESLIGVIIGFIIPDLFLKSNRFIINKTSENDLLKAITIMNNSFKSGRSIIQTIEIVSRELDGPLKEEFVKMHTDLSYGLGIETVFERFSRRVKLKEVQYISTSLIILNKTGGNIVDVFSSIERTFFNNRKLNDELKNLTASAKFLYMILIFIPIVFALIIYILDPKYFNPLFTTKLGVVILAIIILLYVTYIFIIKRTMKLKEF